MPASDHLSLRPSHILKLASWPAVRWIISLSMIFFHSLLIMARASTIASSASPTNSGPRGTVSSFHDDNINGTAILCFSGVVKAQEHFKSKVQQETIEFFKCSASEKVVRVNDDKETKKEATITDFFTPKTPGRSQYIC